MQDLCFVSEFVRRIGRHTDAAEENLRLAALWALGVTCRKAATSLRGEEIRGNLYTLLIGPPGCSRKSWTIARATSTVRKAGVQNVRQLAGFSTESFADLLYLADADIALDEFRQFAYAVSKEYGSGVLPLMNSLWTGTTDPIEMPYRSKPIYVPKGRRASVLSAATPMWLASCSGDFLDEMLRSGLLSRFLVSWTDLGTQRPDGDPTGVDETVAHLAAILTERRQQYEDRPAVPYTTGGIRTLAEARLPSGFADEEIASRYQPHLSRVAFLYALSTGGAAVEAEHVETAFPVVEHALRSASHLASLSTHSARVQSTVVEVLRLSDGRATLPQLAILSRYEPRDVQEAVHQLEQREIVRQEMVGRGIRVVCLLEREEEQER